MSYFKQAWQAKGGVGRGGGYARIAREEGSTVTLPTPLPPPPSLFLARPDMHAIST